jgi:hypothetical protein
MPLTRNLYELDEVVAALQLCLRRNWPRYLFWLHELVVSEEFAVAATALRTAWLLWGGGWDPTVLETLDSVATAITPPLWIRTAHRIRDAIRAATSLTAERLLAEADPRRPRPHLTPPARTPATTRRRATRSATFVASLDAAEELPHTVAAEFWIALDSATRQGYRRDAVWLIQAAQYHMTADTLWSALTIAARGGVAEAVALCRRTATPHPDSQLLHQTAAVLLLCAHGPEERAAMLAAPNPRTAVATYERDWAEWTAAAGRRAARIHAIPAEALHTNTTRGQISAIYTNIADIREPVAALPVATAWWRRTAAAAGLTGDNATGTHSFPDDDRLEAFFAAHFPDDTPDEWSAADQQKSHGTGCAETAPRDPATIATAWDNPPPPVLWNASVRIPNSIAVASRPSRPINCHG